MLDLDLVQYYLNVNRIQIMHVVTFLVNIGARMNSILYC